MKTKQFGWAVALPMILILALCAGCKNGAGGGPNSGEEPSIGGGTYSITKGTPAGGTITVSPATAKEDATITISYTVNANYQFSRWIITDKATDEPAGITPTPADAPRTYEFNMPPKNLHVSAEFNELIVAPSVQTIYSDGIISVPGVDGTQVWEDDDSRGAQDFFPDVELGTGGWNGHTKAIQFGPGMGTYGGGIAFVYQEGDERLDLGTVNALSFWAKSPDGFKIAECGFGADSLHEDTYEIHYKGEADAGIVVGTEWEQIIVPLPKTRNVQVEQAFYLWALKAEQGKTLYIDEITFIQADVALSQIVLKTPEPISNSDPTPLSMLLNGMHAKYTVGGTNGRTVSLYNGNLKFESFHTVSYSAVGAASVSGANLVPGSAGAGFTFKATFDSVVGDCYGEVSAFAFLTLEDCLPKAGGIPTYSQSPSGYESDSWYAGFVEYDGEDTISTMTKRWDGTRGWDQEGHTWRIGAWNLSAYADGAISFKVQSDHAGLVVHLWLCTGANGVTRYASAPITIAAADVWQNVTIPLTNGFRQGDTGTSGTYLTNFSAITKWEIGNEGLPEGGMDANNYYYWITSIRVDE